MIVAIEPYYVYVENTTHRVSSIGGAAPHVPHHVEQRGWTTRWEDGTTGHGLTPWDRAELNKVIEIANATNKRLGRGPRFILYAGNAVKK